MTVHNYRLVCPNGLHLSHDTLCERCLGGREYWCVLRNCEGNLSKSVGYAARNYVARRLGLFIDNVNIFMVLTEFNRRRLIAEGYSEHRIVVLPNMVSGPAKRDEILSEIMLVMQAASARKRGPHS